MKKILISLCAAVACAAVSAQDAKAVPPATQAQGQAQAASATAPAPVAVQPPAKAPWPVWLAFNSIDDVDVVGFRLTLPYGECESVTGFDLGVYGRARYMEGLQINILRNEAIDVMAGAQGGIYNSAGRADMVGLQVGLWNEVRSIRGVQVGVINVADSVSGVQIGLINRAEAMYGFQVGGVNVIRESDLAFFPVVNVGFEVFPNY
ncbi:MAG: hypothetical protein II649_08385 [Kiritimatiellae bacterium]|nr:hypothetical protein [Kiritimatiellia bacterium]